MKAVKAAIYLRISADHVGMGLGVERQAEDCRALADRLGLEVVETFTDNDISAFSGKPRPTYLAMLKALDDGEIDAVICWHIDRLYRSVVELEDIINICERRKVGVHTVRSGAMDLSNPGGRMQARIAVSVARHEVEHARERMNRAHEQAAASGKWRLRRRAFGWILDGSELVKEEADAIRKAATDLLSGVSLSAIARRWNEAGLKTTGSGKEFKPKAVRGVLSSPRIAGLSEYRGEILGTGQWPSIITEDEHRAIVALLANPNRRGAVSYERRYQGSGIYRCGLCQAPVKTHTNGQRMTAYRCSASGSHVFRSAPALDEYITSEVLKCLVRRGTDLLRLIEPQNDGDDLAALSVERDSLNERLSEFANLFAEGVINVKQLREGSATVQAKLDALDAKFAAASGSSPLATFLGGHASRTGFDTEKLWEETSPDLRGKIIAELMTVEILPTLRGRKPFCEDAIEITWHKPHTRHLGPDDTAKVAAFIRAGR